MKALVASIDRRLLFILIVMLAGCASMPSRNATPSSESERVVQEQLEAYNRADLDGFVATYADDIRIYDGTDALRFEGIAELRKRYGSRFAANPKLHATIRNRIVQGHYVIDHEHVTGLGDGSEVQVVAIYEVRDGKIRNVWFLR